MPELTPTLTSLPLLPLPLPQSSATNSTPHDPTSEWYFIHLIHHLLTPTECASIISTHQNLIPSNVTPSTKRDRELFEDAELAVKIWERMKCFYASERGRLKDEEGQYWHMRGLNPFLRLCRYGPEGKFAPHQDGRRLASVNEQSFMTVNIYLNSVPVEHGGATRALGEPLRGLPFSGEVLGRVQPELGMAAVFRDCLWHDGEELRDGVKYLLRTDVMYERETPFEFEGLYGQLGDEAKGRHALKLAEGLEDAGNSGEAIIWYKKAFRLAPGLERNG